MKYGHQKLSFFPNKTRIFRQDKNGWIFLTFQNNRCRRSMNRIEENIFFFSIFIIKCVRREKKNEGVFT